MKHISTSIFESLVSVGGESAEKALELASKRDRLAFFNRKFDEAVEHGWLNKAVDMAEKAGRKLTEDEIWGFFKKGLRFLSVHYNMVCAALELLPANKRVKGYKLVVKKSVKEGDFDVAMQAAHNLGRELDPAEAEQILAICIREGSFYNLEKVTPFLNRKLKVAEEKKTMLAVNICQGSLHGADQAAELLGRRLSTKELERILRKQIKNDWLHIAHDTVARLPKAKRRVWLERILKIYIRGACSEVVRLNLLQEAAARVGRKLTVKEVHRVLLNHLKFFGSGTYYTNEAAKFLIRRIEEGD